MSGAPRDGADEAVGRAIAAAALLGVELDPAEAAAWIAAIAAEAAGGPLHLDVAEGAWGHRLPMADFDAAGLERARALAALVRIPDAPPALAGAIALSGSAAQGRVQAYPADADFLQRVHVIAPDRAAAVDLLGDALRAHALAARSGPGSRLLEVKWGEHDEAGTCDGREVRRGEAIAWRPDALAAGRLLLRRADGSERTIAWAEAPGRPGWCKLDWIVADPAAGTLGKVSNVLDPTWEEADGTIVPLDGFLEPWFQEVYLEPGSRPLVTRVVGELGTDALAAYVRELEAEVRRYTVVSPNHGKAARRAYNIFRITGRYAEAAWLRELFDEPVAALYQVAALIDTIDEASAADAVATEVLVAQLDRLIAASIAALEGPEEAEAVARLGRLRAAVAARAGAAERRAEVAAARSLALAAVDDWFRRAMRAMPSIAAWLDELAARPG